MSPKMIETLHRISLLYAIEPETVFQQIAGAVSDIYGTPESPTMAMVNLVDGTCIKFRTVVNPYRIFKRRATLDIDRTLCQVPLKSNSPLLVQNAAEHPDFCHHIVVALKLRRYLGVPVCNPDGVTIGTLCFLDDRTNEHLGDDDIQFLSMLAMRVGAELERERLIEERIAEHRRHAVQLEETALEKRRFVSMVIHDLRQPVTSLKTHLYLLRAESDANVRDSHMNALENRMRALGTLLDELIEYDQIEAGKPMLKIEEVDLDPLIRSCVEEVGVVSDDQPVAVICDVAADIGNAETDVRKLRHILGNLVTNALKFTQRGSITVKASLLGSEHWRLEVEDTGIGMDDAEMSMAFEDYYSGACTDGNTGAGLGLAIATRLSSALEAQLTCSSSPGNGATFRVDFPRMLLRGKMQEGML